MAEDAQAPATVMIVDRAPDAAGTRAPTESDGIVVRKEP